MRDVAQGMDFAIALFTHNATSGLSALIERVKGNLIRIGKTGFLAADSAHTNALIDVVRTVFNDTVFNHPRFVVTGLKIEVSIIKLTLSQCAQY